MVCIIVNLFTFSQESIILYIGDSLFLLIIGILILSPTGWNDGKSGFGKRNVRIMETQRYAYSNVTLRYALNGVMSFISSLLVNLQNSNHLLCYCQTPSIHCISLLPHTPV